MKDPQVELNKLLGPPVPVDDQLLDACRERNEFRGILSDLYREADALVCAVSDLPNTGLTRNHAICVGLLVRISKLMLSVMKLSSDDEHGETIQILARCILESSVDLQFLIEKNEESIFEEFVRVGLRGERELYDIIQSDIVQDGGQEFEIQREMVLSILDVCQKSGVSIENINSKAGRWGGSYKDKLELLELEQGYGILQVVTSQSVHGSWSDLITNHLRVTATGFQPDYRHRQTDGELLGTAAVFAIDAARSYLFGFVDPVTAAPLAHRLDRLRENILTVERSRLEWNRVPDEGTQTDLLP